MSAIKHDQDKARYDLISPYALEALAKVLAFGAKKYGERNWEDGASDPAFMARVFAAGQRHAWAPRKGDQFDNESGYPHSWHELCNAMFKAHRDMILWLRRERLADTHYTHAWALGELSTHPMAEEMLRGEDDLDSAGVCS